MNYWLNLFTGRTWDEERLSAVAWLFGGLAVGWVLLFVVGWIVRGFMGIPMGKDAKDLNPRSATGTEE